MRRNLLNLLVLFFVVTLAGCANPFGQDGYIRDKGGDYVDARPTAPIVIPEDLNPRDNGDILAIPEVAGANNTLPREFEVPRPTQRLSLKEGESYSLERDGLSRWLVAEKTPAEVWPDLLSFLDNHDVDIDSRDPKAGIVETSWVDLGEDKDHGVFYRTMGNLLGAEDLDSMEDRFRFEIRSGIKQGTTEVRVKHKGRPLGEVGGVEPQQWNNLEERSKRLGNGVLGEMMVYLARTDMDRSVSKVAQDLNPEALTELTKDGNGNPILIVRDLSYARTWASVSRALDVSGLDVVDKNRSTGMFYLSSDPAKIDEPKKEPGFFSGWFGSDDKKSENREETLTVRVSNYPETVQISVEKNLNTSAPEDVSEKLLKRIRENMK